MELSDYFDGHDNVLLSYSVDAAKKEIRLHSGTYPYDNPAKFHDYLFTGVVAYHFECDLLSNIIYDITEVTLESVRKGYNELFKRLENEDWPFVKVRCNNPEDLLNYLHSQNIRAYELGATMGLRGWVWAQNCDVQVNINSP